jgi:hypothetical protein
MEARHLWPLGVLQQYSSIIDRGSLLAEHDLFRKSASASQDHAVAISIQQR